MITKTNYVMFRGCSRAYYYLLNNKDKAAKPDDNAKKRINDGFAVNKKAYELFENIALVKKDFKTVNPKLQDQITKKLLADDVSAIAEASFIKDDLFCAVDILAKNGNGYDIYEVKASSKIEDKMEDYGPDVAFQKYVLKQCGLTIKHCYIIHLNKDFIKNGPIDARKLLKIDCIDEDAQFVLECSLVKETLEKMRKMEQAKQVPNYGSCSADCPFFDFCHRDLPQLNVLELNRISLAKAHELINQGVKSLQDAYDRNIKLSKFQQIQVRCAVKNENNLDKLEINRFIHNLKYPIYHLDFETMNEAIPLVDGTSPYQQVPFQYSLHIEHKDGSLNHREFLGTKLDCQYELAKQLAFDIKLDGTPMAYNMAFEKGVIKKLAQRFPEFEDKLMAIHDQMVDLLVPFRHGAYYNNKQHGSNSIKAVMPALCPKLEKSYKDLPTVHNGGEALAIFPELFTMNKADYDKNYNGLLEYCKLDTRSMVEVLDALRKLVKKS